MQRHEILHAYSLFIDLAAGQISDGSLCKQRSYDRLFYRTQRPCDPSLLKCLRALSRKDFALVPKDAHQAKMP